MSDSTSFRLLPVIRLIAVSKGKIEVVLLKVQLILKQPSETVMGRG
jgi:hypothetical protein